MAATQRRKTPRKTGVFWSKDPDDLDVVKIHVPGVNLEADKSIKVPMVKMPSRPHNIGVITLNTRKPFNSINPLRTEVAGKAPKRGKDPDNNTDAKPTPDQSTSKNLTLKDLGPEDKRRIANLVKELAKVGEEKEKAFSLLTEERTAFEERLNILQEEYDRVIDEKLYIQNRFLELQGLLQKYNTGNIGNLRLSPPKSLPRPGRTEAQSPLSQAAGNLRESPDKPKRALSPKSPLKKQQKLSRQSTPLTSQNHLQNGDVGSQQDITKAPQSDARCRTLNSSHGFNESSSLTVPENLYPNAAQSSLPHTTRGAVTEGPSGEQSHIVPERRTTPGSHTSATTIYGKIPLSTPGVQANLAPVVDLSSLCGNPPHPDIQANRQAPIVQESSVPGSLMRPGTPGPLPPQHLEGSLFPGNLLPFGAPGQAGSMLGQPGGLFAGNVPSQLPMVAMANSRAPSDSSQVFMSELDTVCRLYYREYELQLQLQQQQLELQKQQLQLQQQLQQLEVLQQQQRQTAGSIDQASSTRAVVQETPQAAAREVSPRISTPKKKPEHDTSIRSTSSTTNQIKADASRESPVAYKENQPEPPATNHKRPFVSRDLPAAYSKQHLRDDVPVERRVTRKVVRRGGPSDRDYIKDNIIPPSDMSETSYSIQHQREPGYHPHWRRENGYDADNSQVSGSAKTYHDTGIPQDSWRSAEARVVRGTGVRAYETYESESETCPTAGEFESFRSQPFDEGYGLEYRGMRDSGRPTRRHPDGPTPYHFGGDGRVHGRSVEHAQSSYTGGPSRDYSGARNAHASHAQQRDIHLGHAPSGHVPPGRAHPDHAPLRHVRPGHTRPNQAKSSHRYRIDLHSSHPLSHPGAPRSESSFSSRNYEVYESGSALPSSREYSLYEQDRQKGVAHPETSNHHGNGHVLEPWAEPLGSSVRSGYSRSSPLSYPQGIIDLVEEMETSVKSDNQPHPRPSRSPRPEAGLVLDSTDSGYSHVSQETARAMPSIPAGRSGGTLYGTESEETRVLEDIFFILH
ncbi:uncharacterized protein LOC116619537 isoform X2 [Nematostella vectensis]|uniref:uncharacterized protein LOC116619537 isoform X2 n=1 Tax=Nematostella vectensis TaxID=45351 RepID=UPI0020774B63|nr:uncharacterized protein LOC116619537 isoform X2 [Nematostella vectensis]